MGYAVIQWFWPSRESSGRGPDGFAVGAITFTERAQDTARLRPMSREERIHESGKSSPS